MTRLLAVLLLLVPAAACGVATTFLAAIAMHRVLVATIGDAGIRAIDDTLPWELALLAIYALGVVVGAIVSRSVSAGSPGRGRDPPSGAGRWIPRAAGAARSGPLAPARRDQRTGVSPPDRPRASGARELPNRSVRCARRARDRRPWATGDDPRRPWPDRA